MMLNLFDQFMSPTLMGVPLMILALLAPTLLIPYKLRLQTNRFNAMKLWMVKKSIKHLMQPLGQAAQEWAVMLLVLMFFLLLLNILGLFPYTFTPTTQLAMNLSLALPMWLMTVLTGAWNYPTRSLSHLLPMGTPKVLVPSLIIIETLSLLLRPLALGVRLTANLTAGHLLIQLISTAILSLFPLSLMISISTTILLVLLLLLEIAVAMIQAYVFSLLMSLYLEENI
uniref:ATP synthase subunit a n=1 Tax=Aeluroscalabotes felinus TaxID=96749 RepID=A0A1Y1CC52_AELFE|nr:ATP synthase F0 subunit 6 [Aeluroscalabotes felinus]BAX77928.1 ATPase subunit 6 [Aeluroscalabotes felinus]